jgi:hypothetical protein
MKKGSADGRLFIWKTSCQLIKEKPVFGHGIGKFTAYYMDKQADYFKDNPGSVQSNVADDILYPFNEYIKTVVELGIAGLGIMALMAFSLFRSGKKVGPDSDKARSLESPNLQSPTSYLRLRTYFFPLLRRDMPASQLLTTHHSPLLPHHSSLLPRAGILAFLVFSFFSYPSEILSIMLNLFVLIAITAGTIQSKAYDKPVGVPFVTAWRSSVPKTVIGLGTLAIIVIAAAPIKKLNRAYYYWDEGNMIYQVGAYMKAYYMLPGRFYSKYLLAILYLETGQQEKAVIVVKKVTRKEVKIESTAIKKIEKKMRKFIGKGKVEILNESKIQIDNNLNTTYKVTKEGTYLSVVLTGQFMLQKW